MLTSSDEAATTVERSSGAAGSIVMIHLTSADNSASESPPLGTELTSVESPRATHDRDSATAVASQQQQQQQPASHWRRLPRDLLSLVAFYLDAYSLLSFECVDSLSNEVSHRSALWSVCSSLESLLRPPPDKFIRHLTSYDVERSDMEWNQKASTVFYTSPWTLSSASSRGRLEKEGGDFVAPEIELLQKTSPRRVFREAHEYKVAVVRKLQSRDWLRQMDINCARRDQVGHAMLGSFLPLFNAAMILTGLALAAKRVDAEHSVTIRNALWPFFVSLALDVTIVSVMLVNCYTRWGRRPGLVSSTFGRDMRGTLVSLLRSLLFHMQQMRSWDLRKVARVVTPLIILAVLASAVLTILRAGDALGDVTWFVALGPMIAALGLTICSSWVFAKMFLWETRDQIIRCLVIGAVCAAGLATLVMLADKLDGSSSRPLWQVLLPLFLCDVAAFGAWLWSLFVWRHCRVLRMNAGTDEEVWASRIKVLSPIPVASSALFKALLAARDAGAIDLSLTFCLVPLLLGIAYLGLALFQLSCRRASVVRNRNHRLRRKRRPRLPDDERCRELLFAGELVVSPHFRDGLGAMGDVAFEWLEEMISWPMAIAMLSARLSELKAKRVSLPAGSIRGPLMKGQSPLRKAERLLMRCCSTSQM